MKRPLFKNLKIGKWLQDKAPDVLDVVDDYFPPVKILTALISNVQVTAEERKEIAKLLQEYEKEIFQLEVADRASARRREIEISRTGKTDWLFYISGIIALSAFLLMVYAVIFLSVPESNRDMFIHLMGIIEGVALMIFAYYFGSSKGSAEKTKMLKDG